MNNKSHWERVYQTAEAGQVSWTQKIPMTSLRFIQGFHLPKTASIIDIGGGDSTFVDFLLEEGFENITILDISATALEKSKERLGPLAAKVKWFAKDIVDFQPQQTYDVWHDRATFHFLISSEQITSYVNLTTQSVKVGGYMIIGTFSDNGPEKCSGLMVQQYSDASLGDLFKNEFNKVTCIIEDHDTPFNTVQNFLFCVFQRAR